jgi:hypothetical protein
MATAKGRTSISELRKYLTEWLETGFTHALIDRNERAQTFRDIEQRLPEMVREINQTGQWSVATGAGVLGIYLRECRDPDKGPFNHFEIRSTRPPGTLTRLQCFVGHRFTRQLSTTLRSNLRYILEPDNIALIWSGMDIHATGFFDDILRKIRECNFCIFDTRGTDAHPNVFIEAGIAYTLERPFILASYRKNKFQLPSDLQHIHTIQYRDYRELMRSLYFTLPVFLKGTGLRAVAAPYGRK